MRKVKTRIDEIQAAYQSVITDMLPPLVFPVYDVEGSEYSYFLNEDFKIEKADTKTGQIALPTIFIGADNKEELEEKIQNILTSFIIKCFGWVIVKAVKKDISVIIDFDEKKLNKRELWYTEIGILAYRPE